MKKALKKLSKQNIKDIQKIELLFKKLKNDNVRWEEVDGGGGGTAIFFKPKKGINPYDLSKDFEGNDNIYKLVTMLHNERNETYQSSIYIGATVS